MRKLTTLPAAALLMAGAAQAETIGGLAHADTARPAAGLNQTDEYNLVADHDLLAQDPVAEDGLVKAIIEIPTGTSAKWEISKDNPNTVFWEFRNDAPRIVNYLGYPGNYGSIPGTDLPQEQGGDGDPLDVLVLGQAVPRGETIPVRVIGVLKMLDGGEQDDKLIAVLPGDSPFAGIESMTQLDAEFPGVSQIVDLWFTHYKGPDGGMESQGFQDADTARAVLDEAIAYYKSAQ